MKFILPIIWDEGWREVNAELVDVGAHLASAFTFAIHRNPPGSCRWGEWSISNVETGLHIAIGMSRRETIEKAEKELAEKTLFHARRGIRNALKMYPQLAVEQDK